uniref:Uncharacterized protein n=1 Tax=Anguilla anguilla TaxID=7936 RepID=A0A0E9UBM5_ANGAN
MTRRRGLHFLCFIGFTSSNTPHKTSKA